MSNTCFAPSTNKVFAKQIAAVTKQFGVVQSGLEKNRTALKDLVLKMHLDTKSAREDGENFKARRGTKTLNRLSCSEHILSVLKAAKKPLSIKSIHDKLVTAGWTTASQQPYSIVSFTLRGLTNKNLVRKTKRGVYEFVTAVPQRNSSVNVKRKSVLPKVA